MFVDLCSAHVRTFCAGIAHFNSFAYYKKWMFMGAIKLVQTLLSLKNNENYKIQEKNILFSNTFNKKVSTGSWGEVILQLSEKVHVITKLSSHSLNNEDNQVTQFAHKCATLLQSLLQALTHTSRKRTIVNSVFQRNVTTAWWMYNCNSTKSANRNFTFFKLQNSATNTYFHYVITLTWTPLQLQLYLLTPIIYNHVYIKSILSSIAQEIGNFYNYCVLSWQLLLVLRFLLCFFLLHTATCLKATILTEIAFPFTEI